MSEAKHTRGPWTLWTSCSWRRIKDAEGRPVCEPTVAADGHPDLIINAADAALICAAPDLLAALDGLMTLESRGRIMPIGKEWDAARAAIAKATGESA